MSREHLTQGLIQVYTGDGKGKTTCALGLALRAIGQGFQVFMVQFMKGWGTGEAQIAAQRLAPDFTLRHFGRPALVNLRSPDPEDLALIRQAWDLARQVLSAGEHDLVILDEINLALAFESPPPGGSPGGPAPSAFLGGGGPHRPPGPPGTHRTGGPGDGNAPPQALFRSRGAGPPRH